VLPTYEIIVHRLTVLLHLRIMLVVSGTSLFANCSQLTLTNFCSSHFTVIRSLCPYKISQMYNPSFLSKM